MQKEQIITLLEVIYTISEVLSHKPNASVKDPISDLAGCKKLSLIRYYTTV